MNTPTPRTDAATALTSQHRHDDSFGDPEFGWVTAGFARELERELATERETSRLLRVAMDARDEGYTQSRRRMSALESELTAKGQAVRNLAEVISGQDKELATERAKVRTLRSACECICEEWGDNYNTNPIGAGLRMATRAGKALEAMEEAL